MQVFSPVCFRYKTSVFQQIANIDAHAAINITCNDVYRKEFEQYSSLGCLPRCFLSTAGCFHSIFCVPASVHYCVFLAEADVYALFGLYCKMKHGT